MGWSIGSSRSWGVWLVRGGGFVVQFEHPFVCTPPNPVKTPADSSFSRVSSWTSSCCPLFSSPVLCCTSEWVEALGWYQQEDKDQITGNTHEWYYHWKADELKRSNPSALVPTLIPLVPLAPSTVVTDKQEEGSTEQPPSPLIPDESRAVYESLVVVDFVDAVSGAQGKDRLVPDDPYEAARCRIWTDKVNRECCSPY